tara:strand:- start:686 stop:1279 length:594 start_codon:yes stop_codon:yes gene_type:complete
MNNKMRSILIPLILVIGITGCKTTSDYTILPERSVDSSYDSKGIKWEGDYRDAVSNYYIKLHDENGNLGICGTRVSEETGVFDELSEKWFVNGFVFIGKPPGKRIVSAFFMGSTDPNLKKNLIKASCIKTNIPVTRALLLSPVQISGDQVSVNGGSEQTMSYLSGINLMKPHVRFIDKPGAKENPIPSIPSDFGDYY